MTGLTQRQYECLMFANDRIRESGVPPSHDDLAAALNMKSKSGVHRLLTALEDRGFIRRLAKRARSMEILKLPDNFAGRQTPAHTRSQMQRRTTQRSIANTDQHGLAVPLVGRIASATPIEDLQNRICDVVVPDGMIGRGAHYALEMTGDSMINAGILDGDTVVIQETDTAVSGEIIVALVDKSEATLKRLRRRGDSIALEACNPAYETRLYGPGRVAIQGRLVGLVRRY